MTCGVSPNSLPSISYLLFNDYHCSPNLDPGVYGESEQRLFKRGLVWVVSSSCSSYGDLSTGVRVSYMDSIGYLYGLLRSVVMSYS